MASKVLRAYDAGQLVAVGEKLIDVVYGINNVYRTNAEWLMRDSTTATVRKLRDGAGGTIGAFLFQPSTTAGLPGGEPDRLPAAKAG
jgi:HK97 family phage major capsid protein